MRLDNRGSQKFHTEVVERASYFQKGSKFVVSYNLYPCRRAKTISLPYILSENLSHGLWVFSHLYVDILVL